ncbi:MAG: ribosome maturation factor RimM [Mangrovibacterium sp.]
METIPKADCKPIGYIQKQHGLNGELNLRFEAQFGDSLEELTTLFLEHDGLLVPYFIVEDGLRFRSAETALVQLQWVNNEDEAKALVGTTVYIHEDDYIRGEENFTVDDLVGFTLHDEEKGEIGTITHVDDYAGNLLLTVSYQDAEVMLPYNEDFVLDFNEENKTLKMKCPEGIFDL